MLKPEFKIALLHPKYWCVWFGFGLLALIVTVFPYRVLLCLGRLIGALATKVAKSRVKVIKRNLELAFPNMDDAERQRIARENLNNTGLALFETGMAWFWPDWRIKKHIKLNSTEELLSFEQEGRGVLLVCTHALNLEMTARAFSLVAPGYGVYRPHNNPAYDFIQYWGRTRRGNKMVDRKDVKGMLKVLRKGGRLWYLPDHDYGYDNSVFVPFFGVEQAATVKGSGVLIDASGCAVVTASSFREGEIYSFRVDPDFSADFPRKDAKGAAKVMNQALEKVILRGLDQWMWMHRRYKTMPDNKNRGCRYR